MTQKPSGEVGAGWRGVAVGHGGLGVRTHMLQGQSEGAKSKRLLAFAFNQLGARSFPRLLAAEPDNGPHHSACTSPHIQHTHMSPRKGEIYANFN